MIRRQRGGQVFSPLSRRQMSTAWQMGDLHRIISPHPHFSSLLLSALCSLLSALCSVLSALSSLRAASSRVLQQGIRSGARLIILRRIPPLPSLPGTSSTVASASPFLTPSLAIRHVCSSSSSCSSAPLLPCSPAALLGRILILNPGHTFRLHTCLPLIRTCRSPTFSFARSTSRRRTRLTGPDR